MKGIYIDKFLKQFTLIWIMLIVFFTVIINIFITVNFEKIKKAYIGESYALMGRAFNNEKIEKDDLVTVFTKGAELKDYEKGKILLASYGYSEGMDIKLLTKVNEQYTNLRASISITFIFSMIILYLIAIFYYLKVIDYIKRLSEGIKKVVEGDFSLRFNFVGEGPFYILAHNFNHMAERLENTLKELKKEKGFLRDTLSNISHQLKTPITSMVLFNEALLNNPQKSAEEIENIGYKMRNSLYRMEWLIKSLLKLAKIEGGAVEYNKSENSFKETIEKALEPLIIKLEDKNIKLKMKAEEGLFPHDKSWTGEALSNLIKNSIEHTDDGGEIFICYEKNSAYHKITIEDDGEGIDRDDLSHIFERFYKGKGSSGKKKTDSIGIGLSLSKSIIEDQGGFIQAESIKGQGSKFTITFLTN